MNLMTALRIAVNALVIHKGRSVLTSLGIIIGTGAVISMVSAAGGARQKLDERLENVGKTLVIVRAVRAPRMARSPTSSRLPTKKPRYCESN